MRSAISWMFVPDCVLVTAMARSPGADPPNYGTRTRQRSVPLPCGDVRSSAERSQVHAGFGRHDAGDAADAFERARQGVEIDDAQFGEQVPAPVGVVQRDDIRFAEQGLDDGPL